MYFSRACLFLFLRRQQLSQLNLNAMLLAPGLFDYPQTGSCAGFHSFHHALTSVSWLPCRILWEVILVPLLYADDFGCLSPSLVFKRWILVLTGELTLLPSLSPGCLPDCFTRLGILGHMLMRITLSEREDAGCIYRCFRELDSVTGILHQAGNLIDPSHSHRDESVFIQCYWAIYALYMQ